MTSEDEKEKKDESIKIVLIGNSGVGKTCIMIRYIKDSYSEQEGGSTVGASYFQKVVNIKGKGYHLDIWDTAGQEKYRSMGKMFYKSAYIVLFVYDITDKKSFDALRNEWYDELKKTGEKYTVLAVVGNKSDMFVQEQVSEDEARKWAEEIGAIFALVSAKTGDCIELLFEDVVKKYLSPDFISQINKEKINKRKNQKIEKNETKKKTKKKWFC